MKTVIAPLALAAAVAVAATPTQAADVLDVRTIGTDLARDIADGTIDACEERGYQTSVVVVDRNGDLMVAMRGDLAAPPTLEIAESKANAVILSGIDTGTLRRNREDIRLDLNHLDRVLVMEGGLPIVAGGTRIGAVGVSGAPGGDIDAACAEEAMDALFDRIEFAQ